MKEVCSDNHDIRYPPSRFDEGAFETKRAADGMKIKTQKNRRKKSHKTSKT